MAGGKKQIQHFEHALQLAGAKKISALYMLS